MTEHVRPANLVTSASLAAGLLAVLMAADGRLGWALVGVAVAAVLDSVDGLVARRTGVTGPFGCHLDSLADLVAFGVAPALMLANGPLADQPVAAAIAGVAYVVAGAWRLARFPLVEDREHFIGLPIPPAGLVLAGTALLGPPAAVGAVVALALAGLMVGGFTVPTLAEAAQLLRRRGRVAGTVRRRDPEGRSSVPSRRRRQRIGGRPRDRGRTPGRRIRVRRTRPRARREPSTADRDRERASV